MSGSTRAHALSSKSSGQKGLVAIDNVEEEPLIGLRKHILAEAVLVEKSCPRAQSESPSRTMVSKRMSTPSSGWMQSEIVFGPTPFALGEERERDGLEFDRDLVAFRESIFPVRR